MSMFVRVMFRGLACMVLCQQVMAMSHVPMVSGALVIAGFMVVCSRTMVFRVLGIRMTVDPLDDMVISWTRACARR